MLLIVRALAVCLLLAVVVVGCVASEPDEMSPAERQAVAAEIRERLDEYAEAVTNQDINAMLSFWSDSEDFLFAGDGVILGGYEEWAPLTTKHNAETKRWLRWNWHNVHVVVLSQNAASATVALDYSKISTDGDTVSADGSWTYVFKKYDGDWKVIQTNGSHSQ